MSRANAAHAAVTRQRSLYQTRHTCPRAAGCAGPGARREVVSDGVADEHAPLDERGHLRLHLRAGAAAVPAAANGPRPPAVTSTATHGHATQRQRCGDRHGAVGHSAQRAPLTRETAL
jgi:hypothetical protein